MNQDIILLLPILFPVFAGVLLFWKKLLPKKQARFLYVAVISAVELILVLIVGSGGYEFGMFFMTGRAVLLLRPDRLSMLFGVLSAIMWLLSAVYTSEYMENKDAKSYQAFFLISIGAITALCFSGNFITMYLFYELMTLSVLPFIIYEQTKMAVRTGYQFLLYSLGGSFLGLAGFLLLSGSGFGMEFQAGGTDFILSKQQQELAFLGCFLAVVGFGSKAGLFPLHGWLPSAHPIAPAPASALLSGNVTKMGVLVIIRIIYYIVGANFLSGTWVQYTLCALALGTIMMGSVIASREQMLKRRLAYSTISQVSYILFGIFLMGKTALLGALFHIVAHSFAKNALFLSAGAIVHKTGKTRADELRGIGKQMPVTMWMYLLASFTLVGIPPTSAFFSKWYLAQGALSSGLSWICYAGPAALIASAVFTAAYLFPAAFSSFFPGGKEERKKCEASWKMLVPITVLSVLAVGFGMFPGRLLRFLEAICSSIV